MVLLGETDLPGLGPTLVATVHTVAFSVPDWIGRNRLRGYREMPFPLEDGELVRLERPGYGGVPFINDFAFVAVEGLFRGKRFVAAGDWNTTRKFDRGHRSLAGGPEFFARAEASGWVECHKGPEELSWQPLPTTLPPRRDKRQRATPTTEAGPVDCVMGPARADSSAGRRY